MTIPFGDLIDLFKKMQSGGMKLDENTMKSFIEFRKTNPNDFKELSNRVMRGYKLYGMNNADNGQWDMGHIPGQEYSNIHAQYMNGEISLDEFYNGTEIL